MIDWNPERVDSSRWTTESKLGTTLNVTYHTVVTAGEEVCV